MPAVTVAARARVMAARVPSDSLFSVGFYGRSDGYWAPEPGVALVDTQPCVRYCTIPKAPRRAAREE